MTKGGPETPSDDDEQGPSPFFNPPKEYEENGLAVIIDSETGHALVVNDDGTPLKPQYRLWQKFKPKK